MKLGAPHARRSRTVLTLFVVCALLLVPTTACDERVTGTLVTGLNEAVNGVAVTLITAAFQTVAPQPDSSAATFSWN